MYSSASVTAAVIHIMYTCLKRLYLFPLQHNITRSILQFNNNIIIAILVVSVGATVPIYYIIFYIFCTKRALNDTPYAIYSSRAYIINRVEIVCKDLYNIVINIDRKITITVNSINQQFF
jgi:hypothetical protein